MKILWLSALAVVAVPTLASADQFVTMDRESRASFAGIEASFLALKGDNGDNNNNLFRFDLHGQYVQPNGFGGYITLPFADVTGTGGTSAVGDLEVGAIYAIPEPRPGTEVILHAGLTLPTGSTGVGGELTNAFSTGARLTDFYLAVPKGVSLRLGASPVIHSGQLFARADFGVDVNLSEDGDTTADTIIKVNAAFGVKLDPATLSVELTNLYDSGGNNGWVDTMALGVRLHGGKLHPYAAVILPLDDDAKGLMDYAVTVGLDSSIR